MAAKADAHGGRGVSHLSWIPAAAAVGFGASFLLGDLVTLPIDVYYALYFGVVLAFVGVYAGRTGLDIRRLVSRRWMLAVALGVLGGLALARGAVARPGTPPLEGASLVRALLWRGLAYGAVDGLLLLAFPWIVAWRAFGAESRAWRSRAAATGVALAGTLLVTTAYHLGYRDFRSRMIAQPNIGAVIGAAPTLLSANPAASILSHVALHVTAIVHAPESALFLPPHRPPAESTGAAGEAPERDGR